MSSNDTIRQNGWLLSRVINPVAQKTVAEFWERLQAEGWCPHSDISVRPRESVSHQVDFPASESEVAHLLRMHDELLKLHGHFEARAGCSKRQRRRASQTIRLVSVPIQLNLDRLQELGVALMPFPEYADWRLHEPIEVLPTYSSSDDKRVVGVSTNGFIKDGLVIRQAKVSVLKHVPKPDVQPRKEKQL